VIIIILIIVTGLRKDAKVLRKEWREMSFKELTRRYVIKVHMKSIGKRWLAGKILSKAKDNCIGTFVRQTFMGVGVFACSKDQSWEVVCSRRGSEGELQKSWYRWREVKDVSLFIGGK